jgi:predicted ArsR family transcriptional regulator
MSQHLLKQHCVPKPAPVFEAVTGDAVAIAPQEALIALLKTGSFTVNELGKLFDVSSTSMYQRCERLVRHGQAKREREGMAYRYTFGRSKEIRVLVVDQILQLLTDRPGLTSGEVARILIIGNATNHLSRLYASGALTRKRSATGFVYRVATGEQA